MVSHCIAAEASLRRFKERINGAVSFFLSRRGGVAASGNAGPEMAGVEWEIRARLFLQADTLYCYDLGDGASSFHCGDRPASDSTNLALYSGMGIPSRFLPLVIRGDSSPVSFSPLLIYSSADVVRKIARVCIRRD